MENSQKQIPWCARMRFDGRPEFIFGSVCLDAGTRLDEVAQAIVKRLYEVFPIVDDVQILELLPGSIIFVPMEDVT